ncbi:MAG: cation diffusion facilitator family transporter [Myxococcota bacterium]|nr:cation diffusion facilitator family transporter [Myxococcota bacterium]
MMQPGNRRAIYAALAANLGIAIAKLVGWAVTGAASMLAEAVHSFADTTNQGLLLWGNAASTRAGDASHAFGYGRERYFWAFIVALIIFSMGSVFAIHEGVNKLQHPHALTDPSVAISILILGILLEGWSFRTAVREARPHKGSRSWWNFIHTTKSPELPVVLLEDFGALVGLVLALLGISLAALTGESRFDAIGSISIGVLLGVIALILAYEMKSLLIGESVRPEHEDLIRSCALAHPRVRRIIHLRTQHLSPDEILLGAKLEFEAGLSREELSQAINQIESEIREGLEGKAFIYIEPDLFDPEAVTDAT